MGLNAYVHCSGFERGELISPPPLGLAPSVSADGSLGCNSEDLDDQIAFDVWLFDLACPHERGMLQRERLGNVSQIAKYRDRVEPETPRFPLLLNRVIRNATHCCDWIDIEHVPALAAEVADLRRLDHDGLLTSFRASLQALCTAALQVGKPFVF